MKHQEATLQTKNSLAVSLKKFMAKKPLKKLQSPRLSLTVM